MRKRGNKGRKKKKNDGRSRRGIMKGWRKKKREKNLKN